MTHEKHLFFNKCSSLMTLLGPEQAGPGMKNEDPLAGQRQSHVHGPGAQ